MLAATPAAAQDQDEGLFTLLGRLILGTGTAKVAIDTPQAVSVLEQADLDREQATSIGDLFAAVPGVQAAGASARALGQAFNIRGIGNTEQTASEARIIVTVDGAPKFFEQYRMGSFFGDLELFKRVEVLRGPASSTLYGSGAIGGVVNFTTKDASDFLVDGSDNALRFKLGYDSNGDGMLASTIFATRVGENAEFLGALNWGSSGASEDGSGAEILGSGYDRVSGLAKGRFTFGNDADQSVTLSFSRSDSDLDDTVVAQTGGAAVPSFGTADVHTVDDTFTLAYNHAASANPLVDLDVTLSYTDTSVDKTNFSLGSFCSPGTFQVLCDNDAAYKTLSLKVENTADISSGAWDNYLTFGVQLQEQEREASSSIGALAFHPEGTDRKLGLYAQGEFVWNDRLTLIPGIRVDFGETTPGTAAAAAGATAQDDTAVSPKLAAMYRFNDSWGVFGSVARTERMPTLDELYSSEGESFSRTTGLYSAARLPSLNLEKETATTFELGATFQREGLLAEGDSLQLKATVFHNDVDDLIATTPRPTSPTPGLTPVAYYSNIRAAEIWGAEIEGSYDAENWFAQLAYSNVKSKDKDTGLTLADTPAENVALTLGAKLPQWDAVLGWRASYYDAITTSSATTSAGSYDTHDIFVTWTPDQGAFKGFNVNFAVENVFDSTYRNNLVQDNAAGRTFKLSLAKTLDW
ncbi:TonB-dependent receptor domain-containing protein [Fertoeibacter niger]|nr:TonB-dependent receptor [Fertoeibacter niger]